MRELSPVRGPVGRGRQSGPRDMKAFHCVFRNTMPAWMTQQNPEIPALCDKGAERAGSSTVSAGPDEAKEAAAPAASEKSPSPVRGGRCADVRVRRRPGWAWARADHACVDDARCRCLGRDRLGVVATPPTLCRDPYCYIGEQGHRIEKHYIPGTTVVAEKTRWSPIAL